MLSNTLHHQERNVPWNPGARPASNSAFPLALPSAEPTVPPFGSITEMHAQARLPSCPRRPAGTLVRRTTPPFEPALHRPTSPLADSALHWPSVPARPPTEHTTPLFDMAIHQPTRPLADCPPLRPPAQPPAAPPPVRHLASRTPDQCFTCPQVKRLHACLFTPVVCGMRLQNSS